MMMLPFSFLFGSLILLLNGSNKMVAIAAESYHYGHAEPAHGIDWESFSFGLNGVETDAMWMNSIPCDHGTQTEYSPNPEHCLLPLTQIHLSPASTVLNYGQVLFEGLKAFRHEDGKTIGIFRPWANAERMQYGAHKFLLPPIPTDTFVHAIDNVVRANSKWVPPFGKGALYIRPLLFGSGAALGVAPSPEATFCVYCSPVGNYFKKGLTPIKLQAVHGFSRAAPGVGCVKASGNYAPAFLNQKQVKQRGYDEILGLSAASDKNDAVIEEAGASNFFVLLKNNTLLTPDLVPQTILPGITRQSIIELAQNELGLEVIEGPIPLSLLSQAKEAFCCGTGACITPVGCISLYNQNDSDDDATTVLFGDYDDCTTVGPITQQLYKMLTDIQMGTGDPALLEKYQHWIHYVDP